MLQFIGLFTLFCSTNTSSPVKHLNKCSESHFSTPRFLKLYGRRFSKEDHILFIKLLYELVTLPDLEPHMMQSFARLLIQLLKWVWHTVLYTQAHTYSITAVPYAMCELLRLWSSGTQGCCVPPRGARARPRTYWRDLHAPSGPGIPQEELKHMGISQCGYSSMLLPRWWTFSA